MKIASAALAATTTATVVSAGSFNYDNQEAWVDVRAPPGMGNQCDRDNASGIGQSPIDITSTDVCRAVDSGYQFFAGDCKMGDYKFSINDHGLKAEVKKGALCTKPSMIMAGNPGKVYEALQFHIHMGCEHTMDGKGCDAEIHIVHQAEKSVSVPSRTSSLLDLLDLAVVGMFVKGGDVVNDYMDPLLDSWSSVSCTDDCDAELAEQFSGLTFNPFQLLAKETPFYKYTGSLTTPPCWEVVRWNVAEEPVLVSWRQILGMMNLVNNYNGYRDSQGQCVADETVASAAGLTGRETQPILGRQVTKVCEPWTLEEDQAGIDSNPKALEESSGEGSTMDLGGDVLNVEGEPSATRTASAGSSVSMGVAAAMVSAAAVLLGFGMQ